MPEPCPNTAPATSAWCGQQSAATASAAFIAQVRDWGKPLAQNPAGTPAAVANECARIAGKLKWPLLAAFALTIAILTIPREPIARDAESSWSAALWHAHQHTAQYGKDIVFTYGPLGFLTTFYYSDYAIAARFAADLLLCFGAASGLALVAWRQARLWRWIILSLFVLLAANIGHGAQDLLLEVALLSWGLLGFVESGGRLTGSLIALVVFAALAALTKFTGLMLATTTVAAVGLNAVVRGRWRSGAGAVCGFNLLFLAGWVALGQGLLNLPAYLRSASLVSSGYVRAMGLEPSSKVLFAGALTGALALGAALVACLSIGKDGAPRQSLRNMLLFAWLCFLLFVTWKHGFVRADTHHVVFFFGLAPLLALSAGALAGECSERRASQCALAIGCSLVAILALQVFIFPSCLSLTRPFTQSVANARTLAQPAAYCREMDEQLALQKRLSQLPRLSKAIGREPVDVFGNYQAVAILNGLNYNPRPVFQSYSAYSAPLMRLNEDFYLSDRAPKYILARLGTIDNRLLPLEDAFVFRQLLFNYEVADSEGSFVLLKSSSRNPARLKLLRQGTARFGERVNLRSFGNDNLWMEILMEPTNLGRLQGVAYKPSPIRLRVWGADGLQTNEFRAPEPMLAAGFVASPLITRTEDLLAFHDGKPVARPKAFSIDTDGGAGDCWQTPVAYRIYRIDTPAGRAALVGK